MSLWQWSGTPGLNANADPDIPASDGLVARRTGGLVRALMAGVRRFADDQGGANTTTGTDNTYVIATRSGLGSAPVAGVSMLVRFNRANTGPTTVIVDGYGPTALVGPDGAAFVGGEVKAQLGRITYNATTGAWELTGQGLAGGGGGSGPANTDALPEGATNKYSTVARIRSALSGAAPIAYNGTTGAIALSGTDYGRSFLALADTAAAKSLVALGNVDNTSDVAKPVSTAQAQALAGRLSASSNLSDLADKAVSRTNLGFDTTSINLRTGATAFPLVGLDNKLANIPGFSVGAESVRAYIPIAAYNQAKIAIHDERPANVAGAFYNTMTITKIAGGSGEFGPGNADSTLFVGGFKKDYKTSTINGEVDPMSVFGAQSQHGDMAALGFDVTKRRDQLLALKSTNQTFTATAGQTVFPIAGGYNHYSPQLGAFYLRAYRTPSGSSTETEIPTAQLKQDDGVTLTLLSGAPTMAAGDKLRVNRLDESGGAAMIEGNLQLEGAQGEHYHRIHAFMGFAETVGGITGGRGAGFVAETRAGQWYTGYHANGVGDTFVDETGVPRPNSFIYAFSASQTRDPATTVYTVNAQNGRVRNGLPTASMNYGYEVGSNAFTIRREDGALLALVGRPTGIITSAGGFQVGSGQVQQLLSAGFIQGGTIPQLDAFQSTTVTTINVPGARRGDLVTATLSSAAGQYNAYRVWGVVINDSGDMEIRAQNTTNSTVPTFGNTYNFRWKVERFDPYPAPT